MHVYRIEALSLSIKIAVDCSILNRTERTRRKKITGKTKPYHFPPPFFFSFSLFFIFSTFLPFSNFPVFKTLQQKKKTHYCLKNIKNSATTLKLV